MRHRWIFVIALGIYWVPLQCLGLDESWHSLMESGKVAFQAKRYSDAEMYFRKATLKSLDRRMHSQYERISLSRLQAVLKKQGKWKDAESLNGASPARLRKLLRYNSLPGTNKQMNHANELKPLSDAIGYATMLEDGTIRLDLRVTSTGNLARSVIEYKPGNAEYSDVMKHIGGIKLGERKLVPPWP